MININLELEKTPVGWSQPEALRLWPDFLRTWGRDSWKSHFSGKWEWDSWEDRFSDRRP